MDTILIGEFTLSVLLTTVVGVAYKFFEKSDGTSSLTDKWKTLIVIIAGEGLGLVAMLYNNIPWTSQNIINYMIYGFVIGTTSIGMWKGLGAVNSSPKSIVQAVTPTNLEKGGTL